MKETLAKLKQAEENLKAELTKPILDGSPWIVYLVKAGEKEPLLYGNSYPDQTGFPSKGFRLQRSFHLCGVVRMEREKAIEFVTQTNNRLAKGTEQAFAVAEHSRHWFKLQLNQLQEVIRHLEIALEKIS